MSAAFAEWIRALAGAGIFCAMSSALCPKGRAKQVLGLACGCVMLTALLSPLAAFAPEAWPQSLARWRGAAEEITSEAAEDSRRLERRVIESECAAYISDRASALGLEAEFSVEARWSDEGWWYPWACRADIPYDRGLSEAIEAGLGIAPERQSWREGP